MHAKYVSDAPTCVRPERSSSERGQALRHAMDVTRWHWNRLREVRDVQPRARPCVMDGGTADKHAHQ